MTIKAPHFIRSRRQLVRLLPRDAVVAEIGVRRGRFSQAIWRGACPRRLHLIDCWEEQPVEEYPVDRANVCNEDHLANFRRMQQRLAGGIRRGRIIVHKGFSVPTLATFPDATFDWVYLDANHTQAAVTADMEAVLPKMKLGGIIAGHDFIGAHRRSHFGVLDAVKEFCRRWAWELIYVTGELGTDRGDRTNPSFAIRQSGLPPYQPPVSRWSPSYWLQRAG